MNKRTTRIAWGLATVAILACLAYLAWSCRAFYLGPKLVDDSSNPPEMVEAVNAWLGETELAAPVPFSWEGVFSAVRDPWTDRRSRLIMGSPTSHYPNSLPEDTDAKKGKKKKRGSGSFYSSSSVGLEFEPYFDDLDDQGSRAFHKPHEDFVVIDTFNYFLFRRVFGETEWKFSDSGVLPHSPVRSSRQGSAP